MSNLSHGMTFKKLFSIVILLTVISSCKKESEKACWQAWDRGGFAMPGMQSCDKTLMEMESQYPGYWFYKTTELTFCWRNTHNGNTLYWIDMPVSIKVRYVAEGLYNNFEKIECNSFCGCEWQVQDDNICGGLKSPG